MVEHDIEHGYIMVSDGQSESQGMVKYWLNMVFNGSMMVFVSVNSG